MAKKRDEETSDSSETSKEVVAAKKKQSRKKSKKSSNKSDIMSLSSSEEEANKKKKHKKREASSSEEESSEEEKKPKRGKKKDSSEESSSSSDDRKSKKKNRRKASSSESSESSSSDDNKRKRKNKPSTSRQFEDYEKLKEDLNAKFERIVQAKIASLEANKKREMEELQRQKETVNKKLAELQNEQELVLKLRLELEEQRLKNDKAPVALGDDIVDVNMISTDIPVTSQKQNDELIKLSSFKFKPLSPQQVKRVASRLKEGSTISEIRKQSIPQSNELSKEPSPVYQQITELSSREETKKVPLSNQQAIVDRHVSPLPAMKKEEVISKKEQETMSVSPNSPFPNQNHQAQYNMVHLIDHNQRNIRDQRMMPPHHFNPNASAFVPRQSFSQNHHHMSNQRVQMQNQMYHQNPQDPSMATYYQDGDLGFEQYGFSQQQQYIASNDLQQQYKKSTNNKEIQEILVGLEQLLPGGEEFNSWALAIRDRMRTMDIEGKKLAINITCEMATMSVPPNSPFPNQNEHQAQYNMARLIACLSQEVPGITREVILPCLQQSHENQLKLNQQQKSNLLMFFAELFTRLETEVAGIKIFPLGKALTNQIKDFLEPKGISDDSMKLLLQVFKLAGRELDAIPDLHKEVNTLLTTMMGYANGSRKLSESIKAHIKDLLEIRNKNWGETPFKLSTVVVYCADGSLLELNDEELRFLEECLQEDPSNTDDPSDISFDENDVMDEFDTFMKEVTLRVQQLMAGSLVEKLF